MADALKTIIIAYYGQYKGEEGGSKQLLIDEMTRRSAISKAATITAIADAIDMEASDACSFDSALSLMKL